MKKNHWNIRLEDCRQALEKNNFQAFVADNCHHAKRIVLDRILSRFNVKTVAWGDSMTMHATGVLDTLKRDAHIDVIETFAEDVPREVIIERRRQALLADVFITGTNAVTQSGQLVNLDMVGNRVAGILFGPRQVIIMVGRNKLVADVEAAIRRVKTIAAPMNAIRHHSLKVPCQKTGRCMNCMSPDRICNTWVITEKSFPKGRITVILINKSLGL